MISLQTDPSTTAQMNETLDCEPASPTPYEAVDGNHDVALASSKLPLVLRRPRLPTTDWSALICSAASRIITDLPEPFACDLARLQTIVIDHTSSRQHMKTVAISSIHWLLLQKLPSTSTVRLKVCYTVGTHEDERLLFLLDYNHSSRLCDRPEYSAQHVAESYTQ